jgi:spore coat polysaccharide biosynthesis predicted glycosyltransferase SpsG
MRKITLHTNADMAQMANLMRNADLAITAAGQTMYELASAGVPSIAIQVAENQKLNIEGFQKAGFAVRMGSWEQMDESTIMESVNAVLDPTTRTAMSRNGQKLVDGRGAMRIAEYLLNLVK